VASSQQKDLYSSCFEKWEKKNQTSAATQMDSASAASATDMTSTVINECVGGDNRAYHSKELVSVKSPQVDEVTLATWLDPSNLDDDDLWKDWSLEEDEGHELPWYQCPEAVMGHSTKLKEVILNKIGHELKSLARWMLTWDEQVATKQEQVLWERGQKGQCRQSAHSGVCHPWDPTTEGNRPKFKNQERLVAAKFYGAIIEWAASKDRGLEFWKSGNDERPTIILHAIRAIWKKEKCQMDILYEHEKNLETTYYIPTSLFTCMQEHFPILMWAEMFRLSPNFAHFHGPPKVLLASSFV